IVASSLGQIADVLDDDATALLVEPGDVDSLAGAMTRVYGDPDLRGRLGAAAAEEARLNHTWEGNATRIVAVDPPSP
ncbi:MAG TPA: glycosyltransferase, partial [Solirubrobacterales bacterium]|nr:glycosyltransferase [Solirubrobacterales bacterium]